MADHSGSDGIIRKLRVPLGLTRLGMVAESILRAFWPLFSVIMAASAYLMLGLQDELAVEVTWGVGILTLLGLLATIIFGARRFYWPSRAAALDRLDGTLQGHPIRTLLDEQAIGSDDPASAAVWQAHQARMENRAVGAKPAKPDLSLTRRDPFAIRYVALLALVVALLFGSILRVGSVTDLTPGTANALAGGPTWEGWVEPPRYTGRPTLYLNDIDGSFIDVPEGSTITLRFYGEVGALTLSETVSGHIASEEGTSDPEQSVTVAQAGDLSINGPGGQSWNIAMIPDEPPSVSVSGAATVGAAGQMKLPFAATDDYGVVSGTAVVSLDLAAIDRRYGLAADPEPRDQIDVPLPMPISGDRGEFSEDLIEDFSKHPWANLPVVFTLTVLDDAGQATATAPYHSSLPARRFFDPLAAAIIEQRRDLLWARSNSGQIALMLRAISHRPDGLFRSETAFLRLRVILRRLETFNEIGLSKDMQQELAEALWELAIILEEGDLSDALERLRRAQERLSEAMKNGASDQEIAELMQELREATDDYMRQLSRQAQQQSEEGGERQAGNTMEMNQNDLQRMMDRIQELMEQGRMAEAQQALEELQELMENMRVTQGQGQGGQSEGQQAMEGLAETLREQQGLSDQAFRDLQEQFNPNSNSGQSEGNEGRNGGEGRGQSHEGQGGQGGNQDGEPGDGAQGGEGSLADRQQALRNELQRQQEGLPGAGTAEGDAARDALDRAGRAMDQAEDALRQDDFAGAIDRQSEAMEALREGMRSLGEAMAQQQQNNPGQGNVEGDVRQSDNDPLGRSRGNRGSIGTEEGLLQGEDVYRRARELLDEIRRRAGEGDRPDAELDYLKRLLDRF